MQEQSISIIEKKIIIRIKDKVCETSEELLTSSLFREIVERTKHGVTLHGLRGIVAGVASAHGQKARDLTPHVNCRSTFVRVF